MSLDLETPGADLFLGKGDREGGKGVSCFASEGDMVGPVGKSSSFYTKPPFVLSANKL